MHPPPGHLSAVPVAGPVEEEPEHRLRLLAALTEAADEAPTIEEALRRTLALLCSHAGWLAGRLQFAEDAAELAGRTFWHLMQPERLTALRALAERRRHLPGPRATPSMRPHWTLLEETEALATGVRAVFLVPVLVGGRLFALLEFFAAAPARPSEPLLEVIAFACAELGRILQRKPAEDALRRSEREYRTLFEGAHDGIVVADPESETVLDANLRACALYGCARSELLGLPLQSIWADPLAERGRLRELLLGRTSHFESRHLRKDGAQLVVDVSAGPVEYRGRRAVWMSVRDSTEKNRMLEALRASEERYRLLFESSPQPMWVASGETGKFLAVNEAAVQRYGYSREEFGRMVAVDLRVPDERTGPALPVSQTAAIVQRHRKASGGVIDVEVTEHDIDFEGQAARLTVASDVTERLRAEERLWHAAFYDGLTGLPNRALFMERLGQAQARARGRGGHGFAVLFLDLDRFKYVNDSLGHRAGDSLLVQIAKRLERSRRAGDTVSRLGGDEFAILVEGVRDAVEAACVADRVQRELALPFALGGDGEHGAQEVYSSASIGIAMGGRDQRPEDLLRDADTAMYRAKGKGLGAGKHAVFDIEMHDQAVATLQLENDLRRAIDRRELRVLYQPVVTINHGQMVGFEALARWQHPKLGWIPPAEFVPLAEETGLIGLLDRWVLEEACTTLRALQEAHPRQPPLYVSVNLSGRELLQPDLVEQVEGILGRTGLDPRALRLEITETVLVENEAEAHRSLTRLKALGLKLCLDDFGTGYSSLSYLHRMPIDVLKIDASFVRLVDDEKNRRIVETLVLLGKNLGLEVVAEGVETIAQAAMLLRLGCELAQGYLYAQPLAPEEAAKALGAEARKE
jgi:diguanylate cyclase (GGDEF)-like protein/PAS domain S-box-containing protein